MLAAATFAGGGAALAGEACTGTYTTSVLQPVSFPVTVAMADAPENPALAASFLSGLRSAGAQTDPSSPYRLTLLFTLVTPASGAAPGTVYNNFTWADQSGTLANTGASTVNVSAHVMDTSSFSYVWIASVQCTIQVRNATSVARELGTLIGRTLGRSVPNGAL